MLDTLFRGIFDSDSIRIISVSDFLLCVGCSLIVGLILALAYTFRTRYTRSFVGALALLPAVVCVVIMMVNGNVGTGVAVAGAFSLVRFRSAPGTAREIAAIFMAMGAGLIAGMGYLAYAVLFTLILAAGLVVYSLVDFGARKKNALCKTLHITIPEDLDYSGVFDEILADYASSYELVQVKTTNMGSLFRLTYHVTLRCGDAEKRLIDRLRCRNGNLEISLTKQETSSSEL